MRESDRGPDRPTSALAKFNELTREIARRNEEASKEARKLRAESGRIALAEKRARDLR